MLAAQPSTFVIITILTKTQAETVTKLSTIIKGINKPKSKADEIKIKLICKQHKEYNFNTRKFTQVLSHY